MGIAKSESTYRTCSERSIMMITLDDKLVQLVSKWWTDSKIITLGAGVYSDGRLFVMAPHAGVFIWHHLDAEKLLKARSGILTPEMIQRFIHQMACKPDIYCSPRGHSARGDAAWYASTKT